MTQLELDMTLAALQRQQRQLDQTMKRLREEIQKLIAILQQLPKSKQSQQASKPTSAESLLN